MSVETFLTKSEVTVAPRPESNRAREILAEMGAWATRSADAEKVLRTTSYELCHDHHGLAIRLDDGTTESNPAVALARRLANIGALTNVKMDSGRNMLFAQVNKCCTDQVRSSIKDLVRSGRWLEDGTARILDELADELGIPLDIATQVKLALPTGGHREVDVLACGEQVAILIECKAGPQGRESVGRSAELAANIGIDADHTIVVSPRIDDRSGYEDAAAFNPFTIANRDNLVDVLTLALTTTNLDPCSTSSESPTIDEQAPPASDITPPVKRDKVAPEVIEATLIDFAVRSSEPVDPKALILAVRDQLNCSRKAINTVMLALVYGRHFIDAEGMPVWNFNTPIADIRPDPGDETAQVDHGVAPDRVMHPTVSQGLPEADIRRLSAIG